MTYERLEREREAPRTARDWTHRWEQLTPLAGINGEVGERVLRFCESKRISAAALSALGARIKTDKNGGTWLAFAGRGPTGAVTAIKYRPLDGSSHDTRAENPSVWLRPLIAGRPDAMRWFVAEGESDAARILDLVDGHAAVLVLPAGARTFRREWGDMIPRGATVYLCHDADEHGDQGAAKAARAIGGHTVRLRPPEGAKDWCEWDGDQVAFIELVKAAQLTREYQFAALEDFFAAPLPNAEPLLGKPGASYLPRGGFLLVYGAEGTGKSTWTNDGVAHLAAGVDWLAIRVPRPVLFCVIENEGPAALFQAKLANKAATWAGAPFTPNVHVFASPWGEFTFADPEARRALADFCDERRVDVVVANPTLGLGVAASGRPDETQAFVNWLKECGLDATRAFWLLHHENKSGQISGDWGRHPDTKVQLQRDGNRPRTKLVWEKTRWATLPADGHPKACILEWVVETQGYEVVELDTVGASESELEERLDAYLAEHPHASTKTVLAGVQGANDRLVAILKNSPKYDCVKHRNANLWHLATQNVPEGETERSER